ncbi:MAG: InlB B-repeat-containing protein, partial [Bacilli bacterium]|nr:InlB B-repeat-containing protein [Bacilli bacterium]
MKKIFLLSASLSLCLTMNSCNKPEVKYYTVSFNTNFGSFVETQTIKEGDKAVEPDKPTKENLQFYKWYKDSSFNDEPYDFNSPVTSNLVLYARYAHVASFYNYDESLYKQDLVPEGDKVIKPTDPYRDYYDFADWYKEKTYTHKYNFNDIPTTDLSLYSKFTPKTYKINYHDMKEGDTNPNPKGYTYGTGIESFKDATRTNYQFRGWFLDESRTIPITSISSEEHKDIDVYPLFDDTFKITYVNFPEDIDNPNPTTYTINDKVTFDENILDDYSGFTFNNYLDENKNPITSIEVGSSGDRTITLDYDASEVNVHFDADGGILDSSVFDNIYLDYCIDGKDPVKVSNIAQEGEEKDFYNPNSANGLDRDEYSFGGWYLDKEYTKPLEEDDNSPNVIETGSTIYAKWDEKIVYPNADVTIVKKSETSVRDSCSSSEKGKEVSFHSIAQVPFYIKKIYIKAISLISPDDLESKYAGGYGRCGGKLKNQKGLDQEIFNHDLGLTTLILSGTYSAEIGNDNSSTPYYIDLTGSGSMVGSSLKIFFVSLSCYIDIDTLRQQLVATKHDVGT